ncbi:dynamin family protein [Campylobacter devanensis]|uniref:Dynamin family protein n=1 Tax=Campylobacter devanensis TaxID=3161138 RepID=A0A1X9SQK4_9BACT|nr:MULTISPECIES: dynamin family protein [Campylobacter]ARQ98516.1 dynamin family protein [Campylobacter lanienae]SUX01567.1 dynamin family protein [Campylobacter lanienae]
MENLLKMSQTLENLVQENDLVGELQGIEKEHGIRPSAELKEALDEKMEPERDLKIGILGRVKAGKSSLLNALVFKGQNVLPKAATPMTAALTVLEYGDRFEASIEYYSQDEIETIKSNHATCQKILEDHQNAKFTELKQNNRKGESDSKLQESARKDAIKKLKDEVSLYAYYEQYEQIKKSGINASSIGEKEILTCSSYDELNEKLKNYVGSSGEYTPFTKSITLKLNEEMLKDVKIIDTPGVNDPIVSREDRTKELIAKCDVVFLVSPAGQFLNDVDLELLSNVNEKNGIKEFHIVASQFDLQLSAPEIIGNGVLDEAIQRALTPLSRQQKTVFENKKSSYNDKIYEQLTRFNVLYSSGISTEIINNYDNLQDENATHALGLFKKHYPDYFSNKETAISNLKKLSNIDEILKVLENVRKEKDEIIKGIMDDFISSKKSALNQYKNEIGAIINKKIEVLNSTDIEELKAQIEKIKSVKSKVVINANAAFEDSGAELSSKLKEKLNTQIKALFGGISSASENAKGSETVTKTKRVEDGRVLGFLWKKYKDVNYQVSIDTLNASSLRTAAQDAVIEISNILGDVYSDNIRMWKKTILKDLLTSLQESVGDEALDADMIKQSVRNIIANISLPEFSYDTTLPAALQKSGKLVGYERDEFLNALESFQSELRSRTNADIKAICATLDKAISNANIGDKFINSYEEKIEQLAKDAQDKESSLARYRSILDQLNQIEG